MPPRLISLDGHADIPLDRLLVVVGRHRRCDAQIDSARVSRRHCCLALDSDGVFVRDLGSTNGTWINGRRIEEGALLPGDELSIGHLRYALELVLRSPPAADLAAPAASRPQVPFKAAAQDMGPPPTDADTVQAMPLRQPQRDLPQPG
jgi:pSer/pThr/pTyr-binding forkhead associated (FHA) protein